MNEALAVGTKMHQDMEARLAKATPAVGDSLVIMHVVKYKKDGEVLGLMRADRTETAVISEVYADGTVRTGKSDVWEIRPAGGTKAERGARWATINPDHQQQV